MLPGVPIFPDTLCKSTYTIELAVTDELNVPSKVKHSAVVRNVLRILSNLRLILRPRSV